MWRLLFLIAIFRLTECKVRLVGGSSSSEGRVEILHNGMWGTICDDQWDLDDAKVVCRSLGLPDAIGVTHLAKFGQGSGQIWLDEVQCSGNEMTLDDCLSDDWGNNNCGHGEDAGVICGHPEVVNVNVSDLAGVITSPGYPHNMQRANYEWTFTPPKSNVNVFVCFEDIDLRTEAGNERSFRATVEDSSDSELFFLENSRHKGVCVVIENAGGKVTFYAPHTTERDDGGTGFRIRYAVVGKTQRQRFCTSGWDISVKGEAGSIDLSWNAPPKQSKSGYTYLVVHSSTLVDVSVNVTNSTSVTIDNLDPGTEYSVQVVAIPLVNKHNSALFSCSKRVTTKKERTRVTLGKTPNEGYVQVYHGGQWHRVCGNYWWDIKDANVACRSMGMKAANRSFVMYPKVTKKNQEILLGNSLSDLFLSGLQCSGREKNLIECRSIFGWAKLCYNDASLVCRSQPRPPQVRTRLVGGRTKFEGYVEVLYRGSWTPICGDPSYWDLKDANVVCRSLDLPKATFSNAIDEFGRGNKRKLKSLRCSGNEASLFDCKSSRGKWGYSFWCWGGYAEVVCGRPTAKHFNIADTSGAITSPGFLSYMPMVHHVYHFATPPFPNAKIILYLDEIYLDRRGRGDGILTIEDGNKKIVYQVKNKKAKHKMIEVTSWPAKIDVYSSYSVSSYLYATGLSMRYIVVNESCQDWNVSFTGKPGMITVKMAALGKYSTYTYVTSYNSSTMKANEVEVSDSVSNILYSLEPGTLYTVSVLGLPKERSDDKPYHYCSKNVRTERAKLGLTGGKFPNEGRLEMLYGNGWSTICAWGWDINDANVACRELGLPSATFALRRTVLFGYIKPRSRMSGLRCIGNESRLTDCPHTNWNFWLKYSKCTFPAAVVCGHPKVSLFNITSLTDMLTSPGYPGSLDQADYEWTFRPPMSNAIVLLCIEQLDLYRDSRYPGTVEVSVVDANGTELFSSKGGSLTRIHVLVEKNPSKLSFRSPYTYKFPYRDKGLKMRYFVFNESCKGNWNISVQSDSGSINLTWSLLEPNSSQFKYAIVYYPSAKNIKSQATKSTSVKLDFLEPNTEYIVRLFAFVPGSKNLYFCSRRVRTDNVKWRLYGGELKNEGIVQVHYKGEWGIVCGDYFWDLKDATVACRSLGLPKAIFTRKYAKRGVKNPWLGIIHCSGNEMDLRECPHEPWGTLFSSCSRVARVVCGGPQVESHDITDQSGFISSPGYPRYMLQAHQKWTFNTINPNTRILIEFEKINLTRSFGQSRLVVKAYSRTFLAVKNKQLATSPRKRFLIKFPLNITYFSSFTSKNRGSGMRMRYAFFDSSCSRKWSVTVKPGIGKLDVSWTPQLDDSDWNYLIIYNDTSYRSVIKEAESPGSTIDYLPPNTMYTVTVLALHKISTAIRYCTRHVRTRGDKFRLAGGRVPNEGRVEIYSKNRWGVVCVDDWDMEDAEVACRQTGFPAPTWLFPANPFATRKPIVLGALQCKGYETSLSKCPAKRPGRRNCQTPDYPASVTCGRPPVCQTKEITNLPKGSIQSDRYFSVRKMNCQWTITAPSKTTPIVITLKNIYFFPYGYCRDSNMSIIDSHDRAVHTICVSQRSDYVMFMFGFARIRLCTQRYFRWSLNMKADYFVSSDKIENFVEAPNWNITTQSRRSGILKVQWPPYVPTDEDKSRNLYQVVKYIPICEDNGHIITTYKEAGRRVAYFRGLKYGEYKIYVLAYLGDYSRNTPFTNWKKAARKSRSVSTKTREGAPLRAPTNVTATTTGTRSILVTWEPIPQQYVDGIMIGYRVYYDYFNRYSGKQYIDTFGTSVYGKNKTSFELRGAISNTKYTFRVKGLTNGGSGPASSKVSAKTGFEVEIRTKQGRFQASNNLLYPSNIHKTWNIEPWIRDNYDQVLIVFKTFDLEDSHMCSNDYVKVTDDKQTNIGKFCGKKAPFATSVDRRKAYVALHTNADIQKTGFSAFYKVIDNQSNQKSVWNLKVKNSTDTGAKVSWDTPAGNVADVMVLFKETSVQYIWQAVKASPVENSVILKGLLPANQYHLRLVGTIYDIIQESRLITFTTKTSKQETGAKNP